VLAYLLKRLLHAVPIALAVTLLCFSLVHLAPGDPLSAVLPSDASQEVVDSVKAQYGLDKPLPVQYLAVAAAGFDG
jgi:peptide/nickel transport system permease protein